MGVVIERRDLFKAKVLIKRTRRFHVIKGVEQNTAVTKSMSCIQNGFGELPPDAKPTVSGSDIQTLHLCSIGMVTIVQGPQRTTAGDKTIHVSQ